jgi:hypothetical protein
VSAGDVVGSEQRETPPMGGTRAHSGARLNTVGPAIARGAILRAQHNVVVRVMALFSGAWLVLITGRVQMNEGHTRGCGSQAEQRQEQSGDAVLEAIPGSIVQCTGVGSGPYGPRFLRWVVKVRFVRSG